MKRIHHRDTETQRRSRQRKESDSEDCLVFSRLFVFFVSLCLCGELLLLYLFNTSSRFSTRLDSIVHAASSSAGRRASGFVAPTVISFFAAAGSPRYSARRSPSAVCSSFTSSASGARLVAVRNS